MSKTNKVKLALTGLPSSPKLFSALQIAFGLCRDWNRVIVIGSSPDDGRFQHFGEYHTLNVAQDATPLRYVELMNLAAGSGKNVLILSTLSNEWKHGVQDHLDSSCFQDVLRAHRTLFQWIRHAPVHILSLVDTRSLILQKDEHGKRKLCSEQVCQQPGVEDCFTTVLHLDRRGAAAVKRDETGVFPPAGTFRINFDSGTQLYNWCQRMEPQASRELQNQINACQSMAQLYQLLFSLDLNDVEALRSFTDRRLELETTERERSHEPQLEVIEGGLL